MRHLTLTQEMLAKIPVLADFLAHDGPGFIGIIHAPNGRNILALTPDSLAEMVDAINDPKLIEQVSAGITDDIVAGVRQGINDAKNKRLIKPKAGKGLGDPR